jgi:hypothetical protein
VSSITRVKINRMVRKEEKKKKKKKFSDPLSTKSVIQIDTYTDPNYPSIQTD